MYDNKTVNMYDNEIVNLSENGTVNLRENEPEESEKSNEETVNISEEPVVQETENFDLNQTDNVNIEENIDPLSNSTFVNLSNIDTSVDYETPGSFSSEEEVEPTVSRSGRTIRPPKRYGWD